MKLNAAQLPLWPAFKAVAAGVAFSQLTPNRVGEYGGRLLLLAPQHRWNAVTATLLGSIAQWIALLSGGLAGLSFGRAVVLALVSLATNASTWTCGGSDFVVGAGLF